MEGVGVIRFYCVRVVVSVLVVMTTQCHHLPERRSRWLCRAGHVKVCGGIRGIVGWLVSLADAHPVVR